MRTFEVKRRELRGRWDPASVLYQRKNIRAEYQFCPLGNLLLSRPQYGLSVSGIDRESTEQVRLIRITDINQQGDLSSDLGKTCDVKLDAFLLKDGDVLIARSGNTVGKSFLYRKKVVGYDCTFASYLIRLRFDTTKVIPEYFLVYTFLQPYHEWVESTRRAAAQPNINSIEIMKMPFCLPPLDIQKRICQAYHKADKQRKDHLKRTSLFLGSIDDTFCHYTGIKITSSTAIRSGIVSLRDVSGKMYSPHLSLLQSVWRSEKYPNARFLEHVQIKGRITIPLDDEDEVSFIPMEDVNQEYGTYEGDKTDKVMNNKGYMTFKEGDLLWARISPCMQNGKSMIAKGLKNGYGYGSTEFFVMETDKTIRLEYLLAFMRLKAVRNTATIYLTGAAGQQRVDGSFFKQITIPVLPLDKQDAIVEKVRQKQGQSIEERRKSEIVMNSFLESTESVLGVEI